MNYQLNSLYNDKRRFIILRDDVHNTVSQIDRAVDSLAIAIHNIQKNCELPLDVERINMVETARNNLVQKNNNLVGVVIPAIDAAISGITHDIERIEREEKEREEREEKERLERLKAEEDKLKD